MLARPGGVGDEGGAGWQPARRLVTAVVPCKADSQSAAACQAALQQHPNGGDHFYVAHPASAFV